MDRLRRLHSFYKTLLTPGPWSLLLRSPTPVGVGEAAMLT